MTKVATTLESLRDQPDDELKAALVRTRDELFRLHLGQHTNQVTSSALLKTKRRDIARIMTILNGRKAGLEAQAQKKAETPATETPAADDKKAKKTKKAKS
jgi:large subunit ribosomal protein L29